MGSKYKKSKKEIKKLIREHNKELARIKRIVNTEDVFNLSKIKKDKIKNNENSNIRESIN